MTNTSAKLLRQMVKEEACLKENILHVYSGGGGDGGNVGVILVPVCEPVF